MTTTRVVPNPLLAEAHDAIDLPGDGLLEKVRDLAVRFPQANLRPLVLLRADDLDARADADGATRVWLALESLQVTGSFKVRGALCAIASMSVGERAIAASAGNHGIGMALAANVLGRRVAVVVPESAPRAKRDKIAAYGAEIVLSPSPNYDDAEELAKKLAQDRGARFVSPYDDVHVVAGNGGSIGFEIVSALGRVPDRTIVPFGGGGLATGIACAYAKSARGHVWGIQSEASCALAMSFEAGHAIERLVDRETLAEGLEGGISRRGFARASRMIDGVLVAPEDAIAHAIAFAHRHLGIVLEGSAAIALWPILRGLPEPLRGGDVVCVLTGRNIDTARLNRALGD